MSFTFQGVHHLTLNVTDLDRARDFYSGVLGLPMDQDFRPEPDYPGKLRFRLADGTRLVVVPALPGTPDGDRFSEYRIGVDHISLAMSRPDLDRLATALHEAGVVTSGITQDTVGPALVCFRDPDNIAWECFEADEPDGSAAEGT